MAHEAIIYNVPTSRATLLTSLATVDAQVTALWNRLTPDQFFALPAGEGWSAAGNLHHLRGALVPVTRALQLPRWVLRLLFGRATDVPRSFLDVRDLYQRRLAAGGSAGRYAAERQPPPANPAAAQAAMIAAWIPLVPALCDAMERWDDAALDVYRLPHPLIGKLSLREMLYFSLYHLGHHANVVAQRSAATG